MSASSGKSRNNIWTFISSDAVWVKFKGMLGDVVLAFVGFFSELLVYWTSDVGKV